MVAHTGDDPNLRHRIFELTKPLLERGLAGLPKGRKGITPAECQTHVDAIAKMEEALSILDYVNSEAQQREILELCVGVHGMATHYLCAHSAEDATRMETASRSFSLALQAQISRHLPRWDQEAGMVDEARERFARSTAWASFGLTSAPAALTTLVGGAAGAAVGLGVGAARAVSLPLTIALDKGTQAFNEGQHKQPRDRLRQVYEAPYEWALAGAARGWHIVSPDQFANRVYEALYPQPTPPEGTSSLIARKFLQQRD